MFGRKPLITDTVYGSLMTSFGRVVDLDRFVSGPAAALAEKVAAASPEAVAAADRSTYEGAALYHLRLLAGAWIIASEGGVPRKTAEVFEEAVAWRFRAAGREAQELAHRLSRLARAEGPRDLRQG